MSNFLKTCYCETKDFLKNISLFSLAKILPVIGKYSKSLKKAAMDYSEIILMSIGPITTIIGLIYSLMENKKYAKKLIYLGVAISLLSIPINVYISNQHDVEERAKSSSGEISSRLNNVTYPCICMANMTACNTQTAVQFYNDPISVRVEDGELMLSAKVRDETGKIMGQITNNSFESYPQYTLKSRHDDNGWEVIDPYGRVALQVDLIGSCAHVAGIFYSMDGKSVMIYPKEGAFIIASGPSNQLRENVTRIWERYPNIIPTLFDYSSDDYPSKRLKK
jgi:hypothetical protein